MLNSQSERYPNGIANSSEALGHYLMDHVTGGGASGTLPVLKGIADTRGNRPNGIYVIRYRNIDSKHSDFIRGYGYQGGAQEVKWGHAMNIPGFGSDFKEAVQQTRPWRISLGGFGECLPRWENYCELDKQRVDAWGIPVLHISAAYGDNERKMVADMSESAAEMLLATGAEDIETRNHMSAPGLAIHEVGTARMGNDVSLHRNRVRLELVCVADGIEVLNVVDLGEPTELKRDAFADLDQLEHALLRALLFVFLARIRLGVGLVVRLLTLLLG